jgi:hypothetical protein
MIIELRNNDPIEKIIVEFETFNKDVEQGMDIALIRKDEK